MSGTETKYVHFTGTSYDEPPEPPSGEADDRVLLTEVDGQFVVFTTDQAAGGVGYSLNDAGVLTVRVQRSTKERTIRTYSPAGWLSVEGTSAQLKSKPGTVTVF